MTAPTSQPLDVALIIGSLRRASWSRRVAHEMKALVPPTLALREVGTGELPLYNEDLEASPPAAWTAFRADVRRADGLLIVTPEYNRSMPGNLKNAIDVGSRPSGRNVFDGKPVGVASLSAGLLGGMAANHDLRKSLAVLNAMSMPQPELMLSRAATLFEGDAGAGPLAPTTREAIGKFLHALDAWMRRLIVA
ncbi:MAG: NAD(P)H-dependent oxidoreductase [Ideonella sp.]|nr:NAD(P)H-dependent oxidoreductase [Ideonella sp.]MCC7459649.1 NAD(P)H-dependent oxidoreductase [Nitrospira sp.]